MQIGKKLKLARKNSNFTQEIVAEKLNVSRQTISNWENEKSYPDIISIIQMSELYSISLDNLLKGDEDIMEYLDESTNIVASNKKLIKYIVLNIFMIIAFIIIASIIPQNMYLFIGIFCTMIIGTSLLIIEVIKRI